MTHTFLLEAVSGRECACNVCFDTIVVCMLCPRECAVCYSVSFLFFFFFYFFAAQGLGCGA